MASKKKTIAAALAGVSQGIQAGMGAYINLSELQLRRDQAQQQADMFAERKAALEQERQVMAQKQQFAAQHAYFKTIGDFASMSPEAQKAQAPKYLERINKFAVGGGMNPFTDVNELTADMKVGEVAESFKVLADSKNKIAAALAGQAVTPDQFAAEHKRATEAIDRLQNFYAFDEGDSKQYASMRKELDAAAEEIGRRAEARRNTDVAAAAAAEKERNKDAKGYRLTAGEIESISNFDSGLANLGRLLQLKEGVNTGVVPTAINKWARRIGIDDPKSTKARAQMQAYVSDAVRAISGAAATDQERAFITEQVPNANDDDDTFKEKLTETMRRVQMIRDTRVNAMKMAGKGVDQFIGKSAAPATEGTPVDTGASAATPLSGKFKLNF